MAIITKNNKKYIDFLKEAYDVHHHKRMKINFKELQQKYNVSDKFVEAIFKNEIIVNTTSIKYPFYYWKSDAKIDNELIIKLRLWITNNK